MGFCIWMGYGRHRSKLNYEQSHEHHDDQHTGLLAEDSEA
jgi:hypothetical protein